jgi:CheY-like chemotaxis protein
MLRLTVSVSVRKCYNHNRYRVSDRDTGQETTRALAGCEIVTAAGNVDAVHTVRSRAIDVVVTDLDTPVNDDLALTIVRIRGGLRCARATAPDNGCYVSPPSGRRAETALMLSSRVGDWKIVCAQALSGTSEPLARTGLAAPAGSPGRCFASKETCGG